MQRKIILATVVAIGLGLALTACGGSGDSDNLKQIEQQRVGDYIVTAFSDTGQLKQGPNKFILEFRKAADNQLVDVGDVRLNSLMAMPGMSPMSGGASATPTGTPGRYSIESDFQMAGTWSFTVMFGNNQRAKFSLRAQ